MACIYKIENLVNGKFYIGSTIRPTYIRKYEHFSELRNDEHANSYLQRSFNKYGENNFKLEILETFKFPDSYSKVMKCEYLVARELYMVDLLKAEYNLRKSITTGTTGYHHSEETRRKISEAHLKKREYKVLAKSTLDKIDREKRRAEGKLFKTNRPEKDRKVRGAPKGYHHTSEAIEKIRIRSCQTDNKERIRKIQKIASNNRIGKHCPEEQKIKAITSKFGVMRQIEIYNLKGELLHTCNFSPEAAEFTGVKRSAISNNLVGISKHTKEHIFKYKI